MTHNETRTHWAKEGAISLSTGILYGVVVVAVGHPFDTIKTLMQAQKGYENSSMINTAIRIAKTDGIKGFYRGCVPPLWGSGLYRSIQFSAFEATYTYMDGPFGKRQIPLLGTEIRVIFGGVMSGSVRSLVETPLEYAKIKRQMGENWKLNNTYTGLSITWMRCCVLMPTYFIFLDYFRRNFDEIFRSNILGPFFASGIASVGAWWVCWPLELIKCQIQAEQKKMTIIERLLFIIKEKGGIIGLYRGIGPGSLRSFVGNGSGMVAMQWAQKKVTELGLRN